MTDKEKIKKLEDEVLRLNGLCGALGKGLIKIVNARFVNRRKISKMYKTNGTDISNTVRLYFGKNW